MPRSQTSNEFHFLYSVLTHSLLREMIDLLQHFATQDRWNYELQENSLVAPPPIVYVFESPTNETFLFPIFSHFDVKYLHVYAMMSKFYLNVFIWK